MLNAGRRLVLRFAALAMASAISTAALAGGHAMDIQVDGQRLQGELFVPEGTGPFPVLVIAPGQGYHRKSPLIELLAQHAVNTGWAALRFDWRFYSAGKEPSADMSAELADLAAALAYARADRRLDAKRVALAGKSLGSRVAYRAFTQDAALSGILLLTPTLREAADDLRYYPGLAKERRPVAIVAADQDPNCPKANLDMMLGEVGRSLTLVVVPGNHSLEVSGGNKYTLQDRTRKNIQQALDMLTPWLRQLATPPAS